MAGRRNNLNIGPDPGTPEADVNAAQREKLALSLYAQGWSVDDIAAECGYTQRSAAHKAIKRAIRRIPEPEARALRARINARCDWMLRELFAGKIDPATVQAAVSIDKLRAQLFGINLQPETATVAAAQVIIREYPAGVADAV